MKNYNEGVIEYVIENECYMATVDRFYILLEPET